MGCAHSKPPRGEQGAVVALCRDRSALLADAIRHRYALADAHRAYAASLRAAGAALHDFLRVQQQQPPPEAPVPLAEHREGDPAPAAKQVDDDGGHFRFPSDDEEDAHIRFPSDDDDDAEPRKPLPPAAPAPAPPYSVEYYAPPLYSYGTGPANGYGVDIGGYGQSFFNISYARSQPPPRSVPCEHRPQSTNATVQHEYHTVPGSYYGGYQYQYPQGCGLHQGAVPPPSPPRVSTWDFLNPFESLQSYYPEEPAAMPMYSPNRCSKNAQEQGYIPELEDEQVEEEVVSETDNNDRVGKAGLGKEAWRSIASEEPHRKSESPEENSSTAISMVHDVHVVDKSVVEEHMQHSDAARLPSNSGKAYSDVEVARDVSLQFELAAKSAAEVSKMLEVGKMPYYQKRSGKEGL